MKKLLILLAAILFTSPALATTYYVGTTGNDGNAGTSGSRFRSIQKCAHVMVAGDTCIVGNGTYTASDGSAGIGQNSSIVMWARSTSPVSANGTPGDGVITVKAENYGQAVITVPGQNTTNAGFYLSRQYWVIEGFDITGGTGNGANAANHGVFVASGGTGATVRKNTIHQIAQGLCYNTSFGNTAIYSESNTTITIEDNLIYTIGRLRNGESGCTTDKYQHDHGIYLSGSTSVNVRRNLCYDTNRGFCITLFRSGGVTHSDINIYNNTFAGKSPTGAPFAHINLSNTLLRVNIKNNISYDAPDGVAGGSGDGWMIDYLSGTTATDVVVSYNLSDSSDADLQNPSRKPASGVTSSNNLVSQTGANIFTNAGSNDYTLKAGSPALNAGVDIGIAYNGAGPEIGAFEVPTFTLAATSCVVENATPSKLSLTFVNNLWPPLLPASSPGTFTVRKAGANDVVTASVVTGTNQIDLTLTDAIANGNAVDVSWASGNVTDSHLLGGSLNQKYITVLSNQSCTNNVGGGATHVFTQAAFEFHALRGTEAAPVGTPYATAPENTNIQVQVGGSVRLRLALTCTTADCPPTGFFPYYSKNGGAYAVIPNTFGADNIAFCGTSPDPDIPASGTATTDQLSTGGTFVAGALVRTSDAIPTVDIALNGKTELEYCFSFDTDATNGDTYDIRIRRQDTTVIDTYTVTPRMTIRNAIAFR